MNHQLAQVLESIPKVGEFLLKGTSLSEEQLTEALAIQEREGGLIGEILVKKNMVSSHELNKALCLQ
ncbi:hypothetical protein EBS43_04910, partial [bacterium]|nr:hypothetical protein [bacterium]